jgi:hypothetical protein
MQQQQCRIHVQNPPQTHGDFPMTGTKIQVVHMQPSPAPVSISLGACDSPQQVTDIKKTFENITYLNIKI